MVQVKIITIIWSNDAFVTLNRIYKMPDGKPENVFGFDGAYKDPEFAGKVCSKTFKDCEMRSKTSTNIFVSCNVTANWYGQAASNLPQVIEETHEFWLKLVGVQQPTLEPGSLCTSTV